MVVAKRRSRLYYSRYMAANIVGGEEGRLPCTCITSGGGERVEGGDVLFLLQLLCLVSSLCIVVFCCHCCGLVACYLLLGAVVVGVASEGTVSGGNNGLWLEWSEVTLSTFVMVIKHAGELWNWLNVFGMMVEQWGNAGCKTESVWSCSCRTWRVLTSNPFALVCVHDICLSPSTALALFFPCSISSIDKSDGLLCLTWWILKFSWSCSW